MTSCCSPPSSAVLACHRRPRRVRIGSTAAWPPSRRGRCAPPWRRATGQRYPAARGRVGVAVDAHPIPYWGRGHAARFQKGLVQRPQPLPARRPAPSHRRYRYRPGHHLPARPRPDARCPPNRTAGPPPAAPAQPTTLGEAGGGLRLHQPRRRRSAARHRCAVHPRVCPLGPHPVAPCAAVPVPGISAWRSLPSVPARPRGPPRALGVRHLPALHGTVGASHAVSAQRWRAEQAIKELKNGHDLDHLVGTRRHTNQVAVGFRLVARSLVIGGQIAAAGAIRPSSARLPGRSGRWLGHLHPAVSHAVVHIASPCRAAATGSPRRDSSSATPRESKLTNLR